MKGVVVMKQIYYAIQSTLHGRGSNVTKVISLSLGSDYWYFAFFTNSI